MDGVTASEELVRLKDEKRLPEEETRKRLVLGRRMVERLPRDVFENLSVWQPSVGCLNRCSFCSQEAGIQLRMMDGASVRTLGGAFRYAMHVMNIPAISCGKRYKPRVLFPYLDNDVGSYPYLPDFLAAVDSLGCRVRTSTIGWSRRNDRLNRMHETVLRRYAHVLAGVRFSLTPYSVGWRVNREEFLLDFLHSVETYRPLLKLKDAEGTAGACIDVDFRPDVLPCRVELYPAGDGLIIRTPECRLLISGMPGREGDGGEAWLELGISGPPDGGPATDDRGVSGGSGPSSVVHGRAALLENEDGVYYGFYPDASRHVTDGWFFFPENGRRKGGCLNACWPLRELEDHLSENKLETGGFDALMEACRTFVEEGSPTPRRRAHLRESFAPMVAALCRVLEALGFSPADLFDRRLIRDRGVIRNSGRAFYEFRQIASAQNVMVVPDPVLTSGNQDEVWRIFPALASSAGTPAALGGKSAVDFLPVPTEREAQLNLIVWAVDAPSHSHLRRDGTARAAYTIPLDDCVAPLRVVELSEGKKLGLMPGI